MGVTYPQRGSSIGQITDVFTAFNSSDHTQDYLVVYPDCVTWLNKYHSGEIKIECTVLINGEVCDQYWALQGQEVETSQGRQRLEDGTYFSAAFPEAPLSLPEEGRNGSFRGLRYFAAPVTLAAGEELRIEVRFTQLQMTTYVFFRPIYGQMTCLSHTLRLENTETMHIMQNVTDTTIDSTVEVSLDPTREDYYIRATRYRFRYQ